MTIKRAMQTLIALILALTIYQQAWAQSPILGGDIELRPLPPVEIEKDIPVLGDMEAIYKCTAPGKSITKPLCACPTRVFKIGEWTCKRVSQDCKTCGTTPSVDRNCRDFPNDLVPQLGLDLQGTADILVNTVLTAEECWSQGGDYFVDDLANDSTRCHLPSPPNERQ